MKKGGVVYIMTNEHHTTLYTGVSADLWRRINEHKEKTNPNAFTSRYNLNKLVYYEAYPSIEEAIVREKQIKAGSRAKKIQLINPMNKEWEDLSDEVSKW